MHVEPLEALKPLEPIEEDKLPEIKQTRDEHGIKSKYMFNKQYTRKKKRVAPKGDATSTTINEDGISLVKCYSAFSVEDKGEVIRSVSV